MNLPTLPTDNLYKFIALSGLILAVAGLLLPSWQLKSAIARAEAATREDHRLLQDIVSQIGSHAKANELDEARYKLALEGILNAAKLRKLDAEVDLENVKNIKTPIYSGLLISCFGFFLWWLKVQRIQDHLLRLEHEKELKSLKE